jgi:hypothetical protein
LVVVLGYYIQTDFGKNAPHRPVDGGDEAEEPQN